MSTTAAALPGTARDADVHPATRTAYRLAAAIAVTTVATGAINSATGSGFACSTWPGCHRGHFAPHPEVRQVIEFGHRLIAASCAMATLVVLVLSRRLPREQRLARLMPWVAITGIAGSAVFGAIIVLNLGIDKPLAVLDLACALVTMVGLTLATLSLERGAPRWQWTPLARHASALAAAIFLVHIGGMVLAGPGSFTAVVGWPLRAVVAGDLAPALQVARLVFAVATGIALVALVVRGWRVRELRGVLGALLGLFLLELAVGRWIVATGVDMLPAALYGASAALVLFCAVLAAGRAGLDGH